MPTSDMVRFTAVIGAKTFEAVKNAVELVKILGISGLFQVGMTVVVDDMRKTLDNCIRNSQW